MNCAFCDTRRKKKPNAFSTEQLLNRIEDLSGTNVHHSISLTGGEPLLQTDFLKEFLPQAKDKGFRVYLETNGTLPYKLKQVLDLIDIVAMDIKLPSSTKHRGFWKKHFDFLKLASKLEVFIKCVVTKKTSKSDFRRAVTLVNSHDRRIPFIIQPVTALRGIERISIKKLFEYQQLAKQLLEDVKVIPQMHKTIGIK